MNEAEISLKIYGWGWLIAAAICGLIAGIILGAVLC